MKTELITDLTVSALLEGFDYNETEEKGLYGMGGKLTIQPEYQRNYIYASGGRDEAVVQSVLRGHPIGILYFYASGPDHYEVLDGQQRITSLGRFLLNKFSIDPRSDRPRNFDALNDDQKKLFLNYKLLIYICQGTESEIKEWFRTINIAGIPLNEQELNNAAYSGPFVTAAKTEFSNSANTENQKRAHYMQGNVKRQDYLATALGWVAGRDQCSVCDYMQRHRRDTDIADLKSYFDVVLGWAATTFIGTAPEMSSLDWGDLYRRFNKQSYDPKELWQKVEQLQDDPYIENRKGIYEYLLGGEEQPQLLHVRIFSEAVKKRVYKEQTDKAKAKSISNCPDCAKETKGEKRTKIWSIKEMEADHVTPWSRGGLTDERNCEMLCQRHNRLKGNR